MRSKTLQITMVLKISHFFSNLETPGFVLNLKHLLQHAKHIMNGRQQQPHIRLRIGAMKTKINFGPVFVPIFFAKFMIDFMFYFFGLGLVKICKGIFEK